MAEDQPVHGDLDTVNSLCEEHKAFHQELGQRTANVNTVRTAAKELLDKSDEDTSHLQGQLIDLTTKWEKVCKLSNNKQERLDGALTEAETFHKKAHGLLEWLTDAERSLRYQVKYHFQIFLLFRIIPFHYALLSCILIMYYRELCQKTKTSF